MTKAAKRKNWEEGTEALENLVSYDYEVHSFSDIHFRINRRLDVWPSTKRWYDHKSMRKGEYQNLEAFVKSFLPLHGK